MHREGNPEGRGEYFGIPLHLIPVSMKNLLIISLFTCVLFQSCNAQNKELTTGDMVPLFSLKNQDDSLINIKDYIGKKILVIYFYPKDESMVCTKEACTFRDSISDFTKEGAMVIAINDGSVKSHKEFQQKHNLPFTLLSDSGKVVQNLFGVKNGLISSRITFVADTTGMIVFTYNSMLHGQEHVDKTLEFIRELKSKK
jgi:peroxiredoxin Q/BCP